MKGKRFKEEQIIRILHEAELRFYCRKVAVVLKRKESDDSDGSEFKPSELRSICVGVHLGSQGNQN